MTIGRRQLLLITAGGVVAAFNAGERTNALATSRLGKDLSATRVKLAEAGSLVHRENCSFANEMQRLLETDVENGVAAADCERVHRCPLCGARLRITATHSAV